MVFFFYLNMISLIRRAEWLRAVFVRRVSFREDFAALRHFFLRQLWKYVMCCDRAEQQWRGQPHLWKRTSLQQPLDQLSCALRCARQKKRWRMNLSHARWRTLSSKSKISYAFKKQPNSVLAELGSALKFAGETPWGFAAFNHDGSSISDSAGHVLYPTLSGQHHRTLVVSARHLPRVLSFPNDRTGLILHWF